MAELENPTTTASANSSNTSSESFSELHANDGSPSQKQSNPSDPSPNSSSDSFQTPIIYPRSVLLHLFKSPLVCPPNGMPEFKDWFGEWTDLQPVKKDSDGNPTTRTRFRREADDSDPPPRETTTRPFKPTFSQATQMGNFRHQPLRLDASGPSAENGHHRDRDRGVASGGDKEKDRSDTHRDRDRDGHERLRSLSDRYDRDRQAAMASVNGNGLSTTSSSSLRRSDRDPAPHLQSSRTISVSGTNALSNGRDKGADRRTTTTTDTATPATTLGRTRSGTLTEGRGERSSDWRRVTRDERAQAERSDREKDKDRRSRSRDTRRDRDKDKDWADTDSSSKWNDRGAANPNGHSRREGNQRGGERDRGGDRTRDRDKAKDKTRVEVEEKEPAWMDDWTPDAAADTKGSGLATFAGFGGDGELDEWQTWKKGMKEKEKEKERDKKDKSPWSTTGQASAPTSVPISYASAAAGGAEGLDEIQKFRLMMKEGQGKKDEPPSSNGTAGAPPGLNTKPSSTFDPAVTVATDPAIIQSRSAVIPDNRPPFTSVPSSTINAELASALEKSREVDGQSTLPSTTNGPPPLLASLSLKTLGLSTPQDDPNAYATSRTAPLNDPAIVNQSLTSNDHTRNTNTSHRGMITPASARSSTPTSPTTSGNAAPISRPLSSAAASLLAGEADAPTASRNLSSGTNAAAAAATAAGAASGGRQSKFAKFFHKEDGQNGSTSNTSANPGSTNSSISGLGSSALNGLPTPSSNSMGLGSNMLGNMGGSGHFGLGGGPLEGGMGSQPSQHQPLRQQGGDMSSHNQQQSMNALNALFGGLLSGPPSANASAPGSAQGSGFLDKRVDVGNGHGPGSGMSMQDILAALGTAGQMDPRQQPRPSSGFSQHGKSQLGPQQQQQLGHGGFLSHHFPGSSQSSLGQTPMPHIPPPQQQLPFNPNPANDINDPGRFVADGMVPGLRMARNPRENGNGTFVDERMDNGGLMDGDRLAAFNLARLGPQQQLAFEQQQRELQARVIFHQGMPPNTSIGRGANAGGMPPQFRHGGPSPIGGQNPLAAAGQHQRGMSMMRGNPAELAALRNPAAAELLAAANMRNHPDLAAAMRYPLEGGLGMGMRTPTELSGGMRSGQEAAIGLGGMMRNPQELDLQAMMRGGGHDFGGMMRNPAELGNGPFMGAGAGAAGGLQGGPGGQFQQQRVPPQGLQGLPGHHLNSAGAHPNIGPPGSVDFAIHNQQLQAARAAAAQQQQQQMILNLGLRGAAPPGAQQQQLLRHQQQQAQQPGGGMMLLNHPLNQQQPHLGLNQQHQLGTQTDYVHAAAAAAAGGAGGGNLGHAHAHHSTNQEAFLALFMGGQSGPVHRNE